MPRRRTKPRRGGWPMHRQKLGCTRGARIRIGLGQGCGGGTFEFNHVWPYWNLNPSALQKYAMGLWNHYVADKKTGNFNRHANSNGHGPSGGMEFPWPGSAMIATWVQAYQHKPDPEYLRAIDTILNRWESLRDVSGHLAPCSSYPQWAWYVATHWRRTGSTTMQS